MTKMVTVFIVYWSGGAGDGKAEKEIYLFVKLKLFLMSQVLLSNEQ